MLKREVIENWDLIYDLGTVPQKLRPVEVQDLGASLLYLHVTWGDGSSVGTWGWSGLESCYNYNYEFVEWQIMPGLALRFTSRWR